MSSSSASKPSSAERTAMAKRQLGAVWRYRDWVKTVLIGDLVPQGAEVCEMLVGRGLSTGKWARAKCGGFHGVDTRADRLDHAKKAYRKKQEDIHELNAKSSKSSGHSSSSSSSSSADGQAPESSSLPESPEWVAFDVFHGSMTSAGTWTSGALVDCVCSFEGSARMFESVDTANYFLGNVSAILRPGGLFFGIVADSSHVWTAAQKSILRAEKALEDGAGDMEDVGGVAAGMSAAVEFSGPLCSVRFRDGEAFDGKFGLSYKKQYVGEPSVEEFLVHFPSLRQLASQHDLQMLSIKNFSELLDFEDPDEGVVHLNTDENTNLKRYQRELRQMKLVSPGMRSAGTESDELWRPSLNTAQRETLKMDAVFVFHKVEPESSVPPGRAAAARPRHQSSSSSFARGGGGSGMGYWA